MSALTDHAEAVRAKELDALWEFRAQHDSLLVRSLFGAFIARALRDLSDSLGLTYDQASAIYLVSPRRAYIDPTREDAEPSAASRQHGRGPGASPKQRWGEPWRFPNPSWPS